MKKTSVCAGIVVLMFLSAASMAFAAGQTEEGTTVVDIPRQPRVFIAPANPEAEHRVLQLNPEVAPAPDRLLLAYELVVFDGAGNEVWSQSEEVEDTRGFFGRLFGIGERPAIDPDIIRGLQWDGVDNDGNFVPDGDYIYQLFVTDDEDMTYRTPPQNLTVDNEPPVVELLEPQYTVFSPGVEGMREELPIDQDGSSEVRWIGRFIDERGNVVREYRWENPVQYDPEQLRRQNIADDRRPESFSWDGRDDDGEIVPDGIYTYELEGRDRPGNTVVERIEDLRVATEEGEVRVSTSHRAFSPDGPRPEVDIRLEFEEIHEIVEWDVRILDSATESIEFRTFSGDGTPPDTLTWDGRDEAGVIVDDAAYHIVFSVLYENGVRVSSLATPIIVDTVPPDAEVTTSPPVFGGETRPTLYVDGHWDVDASWEAVIEVDGVQLELELDELIERYNITPDILPIEWSGVDLDGEMLPDGVYSGFLRGTDDAGNVGESNIVSFVLDTRATPIDIELSDSVVAPDFRGIHDEVVIRPILEVTDRIESLRVVIRLIDGEVVRTFEADRAVESFVWDGRDELNRPVAEGDYEAELQVFYENGNQPTAVSSPIAVDREAPELALEVPYDAFAPTADGYRDTLPVSIQPEETEGIESWMLVIEDVDGESFRTIAGVGVPPETVEWDGRSDVGEIVDGYYRVGFRILYDAGGEVEIYLDRDVLVDATGPEIDIAAEPLPYAPEHNGEMQTLDITLSAEDEWSDIRDWSLELFDPESNVVAGFDGTGDPPTELEWDGILDDGEMVLSAVEYTARFTVSDELRNVSTAELGILTDIIVRLENGRLRIVVPSIEFEPFRSYLFAEINERLQRNLETLRSLARVLNEFPDRDIIIEGHANHIRYRTEQEMEWEQEEFLLPLSEARGIAVRDALAILGVDLDRMTVRAIGGDRPRVPFDELDQIWQNRRVEFLLDRND